MSEHVTKADIDAYDKDGVVPLRGLINDADLRKLKDAVEDDIRAPGPFFHGYESAKIEIIVRSNWVLV